MNEFLRSILDGINSVFGNYGWSIIVFTFLFRLIFMPLDMKSRKSMRRMSAVQPKVLKLQEKYKNDKEKFNQKQAELYRKEKINPLSGCLPLLLQWPVLIAMFGAMRLVANENTILQMFQVLQGQEPTLEPWLWVRNLWMADSPFNSYLPDATALSMISKDVWLDVLQNKLPDPALIQTLGINIENFLPASDNATFQSAMTSLIGLYTNTAVYQETMRTSVSGINLLITQLNVYVDWNGLFLLPLLSCASQVLMFKFNPQSTTGAAATGANGKGGGMNAMMKWFFPIFSLYICASQNAGFSLYWVASNIVATSQNFFYNWYFARQEKKQLELERQEGSKL
ncbi:MAG: YidC/Oxa1 family membrane protein insertase [Eubacteriales bacterium]|nr:YidC/Oxa1 family membrane protein insertase [Eubacteriales bacterium]MDD3882943.1 YidC/Oxa1 family membrane protein insertase [Eubacteriales bacterium]MDD4513510.1 YidC/Oxa1 family membrane protein insertase [Eubacteriales bacterium]